MQHLTRKAARPVPDRPALLPNLLWLADDGHLPRCFLARHVGLVAYNDHGFVRRASRKDFAPLVRTANDVIIGGKCRSCGAEQGGYGNDILYHVASMLHSGS